METKDANLRAIEKGPSSEAWVSDEGDWNLAGTTAGNAVRTRTRFAGSGRPNIARNNNARIYNDVPSEEEDEDFVAASSFDADDEDSDDETYVEEQPSKPPASHVIAEVKGTIDAIEKHSVCPDCNGPMEASMETLCVATE
jgi:hypothetical protein